MSKATVQGGYIMPWWHKGLHSMSTTGNFPQTPGRYVHDGVEGAGMTRLDQMVPGIRPCLVLWSAVHRGIGATVASVSKPFLSSFVLKGEIG